MMDKSYFSSIVDCFEADMYRETNEAFNKRSSVTTRGGRPYLYSPREIGEQMVIHFRNCIEYDKPFSITVICLLLGISREGMQKMEKSPNKELGDMIKRGKQMVEFYWEYMGQIMLNPRFPIFLLKNMGWGDKRIVKTKSSVEISDEEKAKMQERIDNFSE
jgi:hypothetical protein